MKFSALTFLIAGAGILQYATANPLRLIVITSGQEVSPNAHAENSEGASFHPDHISFVEPNSTGRAGRRRPCGASKFSDKALEFTNSFRKWIGLPIMEKDNKAGAGAHEGVVQVLPFMPLKTFGHDGEVVDHPPHHHPHRHGKHHNKPFWIRVHKALMSLGPWEGRAVAFVLGCGIGVLLRMMFVMLLISYRVIRGVEQSETEYIEVYADILPPQYVSEGAEHKAVDVKEDEVKNNQA